MPARAQRYPGHPPLVAPPGCLQPFLPLANHSACPLESEEASYSVPSPRQLISCSSFHLPKPCPSLMSRLPPGLFWGLTPLFWFFLLVWECVHTSPRGWNIAKGFLLLLNCSTMVPFPTQYSFSETTRIGLGSQNHLSSARRVNLGPPELHVVSLKGNRSLITLTAQFCHWTLK